MTKKKELKKLLEYDALYEAEQMTGGSVDDPKSIAQAIGYANFFESNRKKEVVLNALDDTAYHCSMDNYLRIAKAIGFEQVLEIPFVSRPYGGKKPCNERFIILWRKGILLTCESYDGKGRDAANIHFNWKPHKDEDYCEIGGGGTGFELDGAWVRIGTLDVREALRFHISQLEELGTILEKWMERPYLHLLHSEDWKKYDHRKAESIDAHLAATDSLVEERIRMLPKRIQEAIGPERKKT